jgi:phage/plasmid-like protein (TIGR03299 family)
MAHELEMVNGKAQMAYAGEVPWHGLGTKVPEDLTPAQMMKAAGLDWSVKKAPLMFNGNQVAGDKMALYRESDNKFLDVVSKTWEPVQNEEAFDFYNEFCAAGDMEMHTAGSLKDGQLVWALAKVKDSFELFKGDQVDNYLLFTNPHKFGKGVDIRMTPIRVVCNNTLTLSINAKAKNSVSLTHRKAFVKEEALEALGAAKEQFDKYKEMASFLGSKKIQNVDTLIDYFNNVFPKTNKGSFEKFASRNAETAYECMETQPGAKYAEGTWWQAFNATTFMIDHQMGRSRDAALYNSWYGYNKDRKTKAANLAVEYADAV